MSTESRSNPRQNWRAEFEAALSAADAANATNGGPLLNREPWAKPMIEAACVAFLSSIDRGSAAEAFRAQGWVRKGDLSAFTFTATTADYNRPVTAADLDEVFDAVAGEESQGGT